MRPLILFVLVACVLSVEPAPANIWIEGSVGYGFYEMGHREGRFYIPERMSLDPEEDGGGYWQLGFGFSPVDRWGFGVSGGRLAAGADDRRFDAWFASVSTTVRVASYESGTCHAGISLGRLDAIGEVDGYEIHGTAPLFDVRIMLAPHLPAGFSIPLALGWRWGLVGDSRVDDPRYVAMRPLDYSGPFAGAGLRWSFGGS